MPKKKTDTSSPAQPPTKIINCYSLEKVQKHSKKHINPFYATHKIKIPFRGLLIGSSGAGKTNLLMNIISVMSAGKGKSNKKGTFNHIYIYTRAREPIYDFLTEELGPAFITIRYSLNDLKTFDEDKYYGQSLVVFDDMVNEPQKDQQCIKELYIRGRKIAGSISLLYLTQSYFQVPKIIRLQCQYVFILKVSGVRDLKLIMSEYNLGATTDELTQMYNYACNSNEFGNFFLIDLEAPQSKTYRKNFDEILNIKGQPSI